jgi:hypothetical protein
VNKEWVVTVYLFSAQIDFQPLDRATAIGGLAVSSLAAIVIWLAIRWIVKVLERGESREVSLESRAAEADCVGSSSPGGTSE